MPEHFMSTTRCPRAAAPVPACQLAAGTTVARARATVPPLRYPPGGRPCPGAAGGHRHVVTRNSGPSVKPGSVQGGAGLTCLAEWRVDASGPGWKASPPRRPGSGLAAVSRPDWAAPSVTARDAAPVLPAFPSGVPGPPVGPRLAERLPHVAAGNSAPQNLTATVTMPQRPDDLPPAPWRFGRSFQARSASARRKTSTPGQRRN